VSLRVAINAQLKSNAGVGGVQTVLIGLVHSLGQLEGPEKYILITPWEEPDWPRPYLGNNQTIVRGPKLQAAKRALSSPLMRLAKSAVRKASRMVGAGDIWRGLASNSGFYAGLGCHVLHFPYQHYVLSSIPSVFNPWDLQHIHYPQFFSPADVEWREAMYGTGCRAAKTIVVGSEWVKRDIVRHYQIQAEKIQVIRCPPPTCAYAELNESTINSVKDKYGLHEKFAFYPAMTWEHKNHIRLLEAFALIRDRRGIRVNLVCTGKQTEFFPSIEKKMKQLQLDNQVRFLGMVPPADLRAIYRLAQFMIFPSLFEGAGVPLVEAWNEGTPVTCAAVTSIGEQAVDAALLFDPTSVHAIAEAVEKIATDTSLQETLKKRGFEQLKNFNWGTTAKAYRAVYRRVAGQPLTEEDQWILTGA